MASARERVARPAAALRRAPETGPRALPVGHASGQDRTFPPRPQSPHHVLDGRTRPRNPGTAETVLPPTAVVGAVPAEASRPSPPLLSARFAERRWRYRWPGASQGDCRLA